MMMRSLLIAAALCFGAAQVCQAQANPVGQFDWLEKPTDPAAVEWGREHAEAAYARLLANPEAAVILEDIQAKAKSASAAPPFVQPYSILGDKVARVTINGEHPAGIIEIAGWSDSRVTGTWRTVLDIDALNAREGQRYGIPVLNLTTACLPPEYRRCLIPLGIDGSEIQDIREFDLEAGRFLEEGFKFPSAKTQVVWMDENTLLAALAVPGDSLPSAFPSTVRLWKRGTAYSDAPAVFTAQPNIPVFRLGTVGLGEGRKGVISLDRNGRDYDNMLVSADGSVTSTDLPGALHYPGLAGLSVGTAHHLIAATTKNVTFRGRAYREGTIFAYDVRDTTPQAQKISVIYEPPQGTYLFDGQFGFALSNSRVYFVTSRNLQDTLMVASPSSLGWSVETALAAEPGVSIDLWGGDRVGDSVVMGRQGYLSPLAIEVIDGQSCCVELYRAPELLDASKFVVEVRAAKASDGVEVDYYLVRPVDAQGPVPTILTGYGGGGAVVPPSYLPRGMGGGMLAWLDRGGAYAYAAMRGGGEKGEAWHADGAGRNKVKGIDDVAAVAEDLINTGFTRPEKLGLTGRSYGGLMASAVVVRRPELFGAALVGVPVADVFPLKDTVGMISILSTELGDPTDPLDREAMLLYSAVQNIRPGVHYPPILTVASTSDDRVGPGSARRFTAALETVGADAMLIESPTGGHLFPRAVTDPRAVTAQVMFFIENLMQ